MTARNLPRRHSGLCIYDFFAHNLHRACPDVVHPADPCHLIIYLEMFRHALLRGHLLHHPGEHRFGLLVNVSQVAVQLAAQLQASVEGLVMFFDIPQMLLPPQADGLFSSAGRVRQGM